MTARFDWAKIRPRLRSDQWLLLGQGLPYSVASALRNQKITAMKGVEVRTTNTIRIDGHRHCDVYLRERS